MQTRLTCTLQNVGSDWVVGAIQVDASTLTIKRARAIPTGSPAQVALRVQETETYNVVSTPLEYSLTDDFIDADEAILLLSKRQGTRRYVWVSGKFAPGDPAGELTVMLDVSID